MMVGEGVHCGREGRMVIRSILISLMMLFVACAYYQYPSWENQYRPLDMSLVKVGMSEEVVKEILGPPGDVIGSRQYGNGDTVRVLQYLEIELGTFIKHPMSDAIHKNYFCISSMMS